MSCSCLSTLPAKPALAVSRAFQFFGAIPALAVSRLASEGPAVALQLEHSPWALNLGVLWRRGGRKSLSMAEAAAAAGGGPVVEPAEQGDASTRFREHVADQKGFARKFGHYKGQMPGREGPSDDGGSTTEDDSTREGSMVGGPADPAAQAPHDWQVCPCSCQACVCVVTPSEEHTSAPERFGIL